MSATKEILRTEDLSIGYAKTGGAPLYESLDLSLDSGSLTCLMGTNGTGKSTLIKTLTGLIPEMSGRIAYNGDESLFRNPARRAKVFSVVLTNQSFSGLLRVWELVALGRHPYTKWTGRYSEEDQEKVEWAISAVRLELLKDRMIHTLSDGEKQRVSIARALAQETPLIYMDEPTAFLDLMHKIELMHILRKLVKECNLTLLISTHDLQLALQYSDELWLMNRVSGVKKGLPEDLLLDGSIAEVFGNEELGFDSESGHFKGKTELKHQVSLEGDSVGVKWTKHALEKIGVGVAESEVEPSVLVSKVDAGRFEWSIGERKCDTLEALNRILSGMFDEK